MLDTIFKQKLIRNDFHNQDQFRQDLNYCVLGIIMWSAFYLIVKFSKAHKLLFRDKANPD